MNEVFKKKAVTYKTNQHTYLLHMDNIGIK